MPITVDQLARFVELFAERLAAEKENLTRLDSAIGDADHGINMDRGFQAVLGKLPEISSDSAGGLFKGVGMTLVSTVGGASGPLYGTFFLRAGGALGDTTDVTAEQLAAALRAGLEGVIQRGKAELDDKTMVDALSGRRAWSSTGTPGHPSRWSPPGSGNASSCRSPASTWCRTRSLRQPRLPQRAAIA